MIKPFEIPPGWAPTLPDGTRFVVDSWHRFIRDPRDGQIRRVTVTLEMTVQMSPEEVTVRGEGEPCSATMIDPGQPVAAQQTVSAHTD